MVDESDRQEWSGAAGAGRDGRPRDLGGYIRMQRQLAELSLRQLAGMTKVSNAYLSQVERGLHQPSLRVLRSIADALNLSADTMLAHAGLIDVVAAADDAGTRSGTEAAILDDPELSPEDRQALLRVYRSLRQRPGGA